jgi:hypothetical protein
MAWFLAGYQRNLGSITDSRRNLSCIENADTTSGIHTASFAIGTGYALPGDKVAVA